MGKIDTSEWKEFRIGDYFKVEYGRFHAKDELGTGTVNYSNEKKSCKQNQRNQC